MKYNANIDHVCGSQTTDNPTPSNDWPSANNTFVLTKYLTLSDMLRFLLPCHRRVAVGVERCPASMVLHPTSYEPWYGPGTYRLVINL